MEGPRAWACENRPVSLRTSARLRGLPRYEPGLTTAEVLAGYGLERAVKLASNESPFPPLEPVQQAMREGFRGLNRYPDGAARDLRRVLADRHGVGPGQVVVGNGSCELILLAAQALLDPGATLVHAQPSFAVYPLLAPLSGARARAVPLAADGGHDLDAMAASVDETVSLVILCNPNNPTGVHRPAGEIERFLDGLPEDLAVLVDEAYFDFVAAPDAGRVLALAGERPNLLVTRTFSKAHGLCGLRVGYGVGAPAFVEAIDRVRQPFNTNALAQIAARESLRHPAALAGRVAATLSERTRLERGLSALGVRFTPSQTNFMLLDPGSDGTSAGLAAHEQLLRRGVIVRDGGSLGCPGRLRVTVGTPEENDALLRALAEVRGSAPVPTTTPAGRTPR
jgi:histidinol-phosphate aminotransferase